MQNIASKFSFVRAQLILSTSQGGVMELGDTHCRWRCPHSQMCAVTVYHEAFTRLLTVQSDVFQRLINKQISSQAALLCDKKTIQLCILPQRSPQPHPLEAHSFLSCSSPLSRIQLIATSSVMVAQDRFMGLWSEEIRSSEQMQEHKWSSAYSLLPMPLVLAERISLPHFHPHTHLPTVYVIYAVGQHPCDAPTSHVFSPILFHQSYSQG